MIECFKFSCPKWFSSWNDVYVVNNDPFLSLTMTICLQYLPCFCVVYHFPKIICCKGWYMCITSRWDGPMCTDLFKYKNVYNTWHKHKINFSIIKTSACLVIFTNEKQLKWKKLACWSIIWFVCGYWTK